MSPAAQQVAGLEDRGPQIRKVIRTGSPLPQRLAEDAERRVRRPPEMVGIRFEPSVLPHLVSDREDAEHVHGFEALPLRIDGTVPTV